MPFEKEQFEGIRLAIMTPTTGDVCVRYVASLVDTVTQLGYADVDFGCGMTTGASVQKQRNQLITDAMDSDKNFTHFLFVDSDQGWNWEDIFRLFILDRPVIGIASQKKQDAPDFACIWINADQVVCERGSMEVAGVGTGFLMIQRGAIEKMHEKYPELKVHSRDPEINKDISPNSYRLFSEWQDDFGEEWSEDLMFCRRWRALGERVWIFAEGSLIHVGTKEYSGSVSSQILGAATQEN